MLIKPQFHSREKLISFPTVNLYNLFVIVDTSDFGLEPREEFTYLESQQIDIPLQFLCFPINIRQDLFSIISICYHLLLKVKSKKLAMTYFRDRFG